MYFPFMKMMMLLVVIIIIMIIMLLCPAQCLSKVVFFLHFSCFLNAALCKLNYLQVIRIFSKVSLTYSFSRLFLYFLGFLL